MCCNALSWVCGTDLRECIIQLSYFVLIVVVFVHTGWPDEHWYTKFIIVSFKHYEGMKHPPETRV